MEYKNIQALLDRYWQGETSLEEEAQLKAYFAQENLPADMLPYRPFFEYANAAQDVALPDDFEAGLLQKLDIPTATAPKGRVVPLYRWVARAVAVLLLGVLSYVAYDQYGYATPKQGAQVIVLDDAEDAAEAYAKVKAALYLVSAKMNKGTNTAEHSFAKISAIDKIRNK